MQVLYFFENIFGKYWLFNPHPYPLTHPTSLVFLWKIMAAQFLRFNFYPSNVNLCSLLKTDLCRSWEALLLGKYIKVNAIDTGNKVHLSTGKGMLLKVKYIVKTPNLYIWIQYLFCIPNLSAYACTYHSPIACI